MEINIIDMKKIIIYLNGKRGIILIEKLLQNNYKDIIVFTSKILIELNYYKKKFNLKVFKINNVNTVSHYKKVKNLNPALAIVAGFSKIFKENLINLPQLGTLNLHGGPVPMYRGGSPLNWQIINGEKKIGISIIKMNELIDGGEILKVNYFKLTDDDDISKVHDKANRLFTNMVLKLLPQIFKGHIKAIKQKENKAKYWHQRNDQDGKINWSTMNVIQVHNLVRALTIPYKGAFAYHNKEKVRIFKSKISDKKFHGTPGRVVKIKNNNLLVICNDSGLIIEDYRFEKKNKKLLNGMYLV